MKYNKILIFFAFALPVSIGLRLMQLFFIIEPETGFYKPEYSAYGIAILIIIFSFAAVTAIFALFSHRSPEHPPKVNLPLGLASIVIALSVAAELYFTDFTGVLAWQSALFKFFAAVAALWFAAYSITDYLGFKLPALTFAIPAIYLIIKIICSYTAISSLALISDNALLLGANCASLLFFLSFGKLYNNIDTELGFRRLLATGLASIILCFTQSVPNILFNLITKVKYYHTAPVTSVGVFFTGVFICAFVFSHFKYSNACSSNK